MGWGAGRMTHLAAGDGLSLLWGSVSLRLNAPPPPSLSFPPLRLARLTLLRAAPAPVPSGVDGDDLAAATSDQQDALQPFRQNLEELHIWRER